MSEVIYCTECANPWGVILGRGETPNGEAAMWSQAMMIEAWMDQAECDVDEGAEFDVARLPTVTPVEVIFLTEALARFMDFNLGIDPTFVPDTWNELAWVDMPSWLFKGRKRRWAFRWDCCDLGWAMNYVRAS